MVSYAVTMPDREFQALRRLLAKVPRGRGRRYPAAVRDRVCAWATERRARGDQWEELADELGIHPQTLQRWAPPPPEPASKPACFRQAACSLTTGAPLGLGR